MEYCKEWTNPAPIPNLAFQLVHAILQVLKFRPRNTRLRQLGADLDYLLGIVRRHRESIEPR